MHQKNKSEVSNFEVSISNREKEVLELLCEGKTTKEIANSLMLSPHTINSHKKNMMEKVGAKNSVEMTFKILQRVILLTFLMFSSIMGNSQVDFDLNPNWSFSPFLAF